MFGSNKQNDDIEPLELSSISENVQEALANLRLQQNSISVNTIEFNKKLDEMTEILSLHAKLARMRYSHDLGDRDGCIQNFTQKLTALSKLQGKSNEEVARVSKKLLSAMERHRKIELIEELLLRIETVGFKRVD